MTSVHRLMQAVAIENSYPVEYLVDEAYIDKEDQGDLAAMTPTIVDMLGVFFLKASSYEFMAESSRQGSTAYWYSMEYAAQNKSVFHTLFMGAAKKAGIINPGACHGDELMYLFNVHLPLVLCDTSDLSVDLSACTEATDPPDMICSQQLCRDCVLGQFREKWHNCITGELNDEELGVSALLASMWTSFAASGDPGQGAKPWSREQPWYSRITTTVDQRWDYRLTYHHARDEMGNSTSQTLSRSDTTCWLGSAKTSALATQSANSLPGTRCQTMLRWEVTMATAGFSATATLGGCVKRVSRGLPAKPMWTIAYENSFP